MGIDPGLRGTGWALLERGGAQDVYAAGGTIRHGIPGRGHWDAKITRIVDEIVQTVSNYDPVVITIENPAFGSWGRDTAATVGVQATTELCWRAAWTLRDRDVRLLRPDRSSKIQRAQHLPGIIEGWPVKSSEHERDAGWIAVRTATQPPVERP